MTKKKKSFQKKQSKKKNMKRSKENDASRNHPPTWVEKISWQPLSTSAPAIEAPVSFTVVSWNILAEAYTSRRSHPHLPLSYQSVVFERRKRRPLLQQTLHRLATTVGVDIFCLQEVDLPEQVTHYLQNSLAYQGCQTPTNKAGGGISSRVDACAIYFSTEQFEWLDHNQFPPQVIHLDDIASLGRTTATGTTRGKNSSSNLACLGLSSSFLRHNVGLIAALRHKSTQQTVVVVNTHLYWHPGFEYVKLCQMHYVLQRATAFAASISSHFSQQGEQLAATTPQSPALIICGDLNSLPKSAVHQYLAQGSVNAKRSAPWYYFWNPFAYDDDDSDGDGNIDEDDGSDVNDDDNDDDVESSDRDEETEEADIDGNEELDDVMREIFGEEEESDLSVNQEADLIENGDKLTSDCHGEEDNSISFLNTKLTNLDLKPSPAMTTTTDDITKEVSYSRNDVRYLLDYTLNRLCRWLRILGIDAVMETEAEEQLRTKDGLLKPLFDRCQKERRTLVTTSTKLAARSSCPPGTFLISPQVLPNLELALAQLLLLHGVALEPSNFLSRCVVCNGSIQDVTDTEQKRRVLSEHKAPLDLSLELEVYECNGCGQGYWWCERPTSSASRVKNQATRLLEVCVRAGVPIKGEMSIFNFVDVDALRKEGWDGPEPLEHLDAIDWLKDENLSHPFELQSAYAASLPVDSTAEVDDSIADTESGTVKAGGDSTDGGELLPFTNVTHGFVGTLDYVFFDRNCLIQTDRLYVPTSFAELNEPNLRNGHCLPSNLWPSDHLAVGARLAFQNVPPANSQRMEEQQRVVIDQAVDADEPLATSPLDPPDQPSLQYYCQPLEAANGAPLDGVSSSSPAASHGAVCACGCVPKIRSLFEMAELRRQAKLAKMKQPQALE